MGTNFYARGYDYEKEHLSPEWHIGKRSAAGIYCWDCDITLCKAGPEAIHFSAKNEFYKQCPKCGKEATKEGLEDGAAGRELGFNKQSPKRKTGVASCASFSWAMSKESFADIQNRIRVKTCDFDDHEALDDVQVVEDEYGQLYTVEEFNKLLEECPIRYTDNVGREFS